MELAVVRHLSKEIEAGNGAWAVLVANEQLANKHPLQRAFIFKARQLCRMSSALGSALAEGKTLRELPPILQREVKRSSFSFVGRREKPVVGAKTLSGRAFRVAEERQARLTRLTIERQSLSCKKICG